MGNKGFPADVICFGNEPGPWHESFTVHTRDDMCVTCAKVTPLLKRFFNIRKSPNDVFRSW